LTTEKPESLNGEIVSGDLAGISKREGIGFALTKTEAEVS